MPDTAKFCKNCRHHVPATPGVVVARCEKVALFPGLNPVTGEKYLMGCEQARSTNVDWNEKPMCGPDGRWFEARI